MMYRNVECPTCGNVIRIKCVWHPQKCDYCRRMLRVKVTNGGKRWETEAVNFDQQEQLKRQNTNNMHNDIQEE